MCQACQDAHEAVQMALANHSLQLFLAPMMQGYRPTSPNATAWLWARGGRGRKKWRELGLAWLFRVRSGTQVLYLSTDDCFVTSFRNHSAPVINNHSVKSWKFSMSPRVSERAIVFWRICHRGGSCQQEGFASAMATKKAFLGKGCRHGLVVLRHPCLVREKKMSCTHGILRNCRCMLCRLGAPQAP